ncbi:helix-turn-helix transcriptional regulator [Nibribacter koreensis]|uniref:HTH cro/C1-type domain-containing protein n=1 Tax=Nibribacter koreensis TaxID=1084519 RepID=A0ABP8FBM1_9BACT
MRTLIDNIIYLRRKNGLTQEQLGKKLGLKRSLIGAYEEGRATPKIPTLVAVAKLFGIMVDELLIPDLAAKKYRLAKGVYRSVFWRGNPYHCIKTNYGPWAKSIELEITRDGVSGETIFLNADTARALANDLLQYANGNTDLLKAHRDFWQSIDPNLPLNTKGGLTS